MDKTTQKKYFFRITSNHQLLCLEHVVLSIGPRSTCFFLIINKYEYKQVKQVYHDQFAKYNLRRPEDKIK